MCLPQMSTPRVGIVQGEEWIRLKPSLKALNNQLVEVLFDGGSGLCDFGCKRSGVPCEIMGKLATCAKSRGWDVRIKRPLKRIAGDTTGICLSNARTRRSGGIAGMPAIETDPSNLIRLTPA